MTDSAARTTRPIGHTRRARVVVLGEFSAGKSTLINLIAGESKLRTQVTATQMPAIWMSHGDEQAYLVDLEGNETPVDLENLADVSTSNVAYIRAFMKSPILTQCDLIDTPGNSDPNIAAIAWERIAAMADVAVWCSSSTQAWRQSEKAAWNEVPQRVRDNSILLLTRSDKLLSEEDRDKVLRRVKHEAGGLFSKIHMASLMDFDEVREPMRDLIKICKGIDVSDSDDTPSEVPTERSEENADQRAIDAILEEAAMDIEMEIDMTEPVCSRTQLGFATALWHELTVDVSADDPAGIDRAFRKFLGTLDAEVASLRDAAAIKIAS